MCINVGRHQVAGEKKCKISAAKLNSLRVEVINVATETVVPDVHHKKTPFTTLVPTTRSTVLMLERSLGRMPKLSRLVLACFFSYRDFGAIPVSVTTKYERNAVKIREGSLFFYYDLMTASLYSYFLTCQSKISASVSPTATTAACPSDFRAVFAQDHMSTN